MRIAAGTLYGAIENLLKLNFIRPLDSDDSRRKVYGLTAAGKEVLDLDIARMSHMIAVAGRTPAQGEY